jgi:hypothetical protein
MVMASDWQSFDRQSPSPRVYGSVAWDAVTESMVEYISPIFCFSPRMIVTSSEQRILLTAPQPCVTALVNQQCELAL